MNTSDCQNLSIFDFGMAKFLRTSGNVAGQNKDFRTAAIYYQESLDICETLDVKSNERNKNRNLQMRNILDLIKIHRASANDGEIARLLIQALKMQPYSSESNILTKKQPQISRLAATTAHVVMEIGDVKTAIRYAKMALVIAEEKLDNECRSAILVALGRMYFTSGATQKAVRYHKEAMVALYGGEV